MGWIRLSYNWSPPGTGDAQLTLAQSSKLSGSIVISTPQDVALTDARKGINMFKKLMLIFLVLWKIWVISYVIIVIKNIIYFQKMVWKKKLKNLKYLLGEIPIDTNLRIQSDNGIPTLIDNPDGEISKNLYQLLKT